MCGVIEQRMVKKLVRHCEQIRCMIRLIQSNVPILIWLIFAYVIIQITNYSVSIKFINSSSEDYWFIMLQDANIDQIIQQESSNSSPRKLALYRKHEHQTHILVFLVHINNM